MCGGLSCCGAAKRYCRGRRSGIARGRLCEAASPSGVSTLMVRQLSTKRAAAACRRPLAASKKSARLGSGPGHRQQLARQAGVEEQELAPLVHEPRSAPRTRSPSRGSIVVAHDLLGVGRATARTLGTAHRCPTPSRPGPRVAAVAGQERSARSRPRRRAAFDLLRPPRPIHVASSSCAYPRNVSPARIRSRRLRSVGRVVTSRCQMPSQSSRRVR